MVGVRVTTDEERFIDSPTVSHKCGHFWRWNIVLVTRKVSRCNNHLLLSLGGRDGHHCCNDVSLDEFRDWSTLDVSAQQNRRSWCCLRIAVDQSTALTGQSKDFDPGTGWQCPAAWSLMCVEDAGSSCIVHEVLEGHMRSVLDCLSVPESFLKCC